MSVKQLLGVNYSCTDFTSILNDMDSSIRSQKKGYISITNTESMYHALRLEEHLQYINQADYSCCDGVGVVWGAKFKNVIIPRLHGPDLMIHCCRHGVAKKWRHFFYGGKEGVPELLEKRLGNRFPGMITAGGYSPPFRELTPEEDDKVVEMINEAKPDILWVGLGLLKQEKWIAQHRDRLNVPWMVGVGAAFDFYAGTVKRAPRFFRDLGLEWLYRGLFEPRMIIRNIYSLKMVFRILWEGRRAERKPSV
mgnify:CR=1 FL=1